MSHKNNAKKKDIKNRSQSHQKLPQRLSISELADSLKEDPVYGNTEIMQDYSNYLIIEYSKSTNPWNNDHQKYKDLFTLKQNAVVEPLRQEPAFIGSHQAFFLHTLCCLAKLNTYEHGENEPTGWFGTRYINRGANELEVDRDEFKDLLLRKDCLLPVFWYPDEPDNTKNRMEVHDPWT